MNFYERLFAAVKARCLDVTDVLMQAGITNSKQISYQAGADPTVSDLIAITKAVGCSSDELLGLEPTPNLKKPIGEELTAIGMTQSVLREMAKSMLEARVSHAFDAATKNEKSIDARIDAYLKDCLEDVAKEAIQKRLAGLRLDFTCNVAS